VLVTAVCVLSLSLALVYLIISPVSFCLQFSGLRIRDASLTRNRFPS